jgi:hypothetical protein
VNIEKRISGKVFFKKMEKRAYFPSAKWTQVRLPGAKLRCDLAGETVADEKLLG